MGKSRRALHFLADMAAVAVRHPAWFAREWAHHAVEVRASGVAQFRHNLRQIHHEQLDPRLENLSVEIGGAGTGVLYGPALIVSRVCRLLAPQRVLEIGTFRGTMTYHIARNTPESCQIWTLDLPPNTLGEISGGMIESDVGMASMDRAHVGHQWRDQPEGRKITQLWGDSLKFDLSPYAPFDLVYIDGSHAEPWVARDTENAFKYLSPTGAILWDDCYWSDVQRVLARWGKERPIYLFEDKMTAGYLQIDGKPVTAP